MKRLLAIMLCCALVFPNSNYLQEDIERGESYSTARGFKKDVENGRLMEKTNRAIENLIKTSIGELKKRGANALAERVSYEYESTYRDFIDSRGVGDHAGIQWLLKVHSEIEFVLGETICRALRLHDLYVLAHTIPVVFRCLDNVDSVEYMLHFMPLCGVVSYWTAYGVCVGASLGTGVVFLCGMVGMGVEQIVIRFIAPPLSIPVWKKVCRPV